jgi:hypothetical protein
MSTDSWDRLPEDWDSWLSPLVVEILKIFITVNMPTTATYIQNE